MLLRNIIVYAILIYVKRKRALEIKQRENEMRTDYMVKLIYLDDANKTINCMTKSQAENVAKSELSASLAIEAYIIECRQIEKLVKSGY